MKINKIAKNKNGKYKIIFDNNESLTVYDDVILDNGILFKQELTHEELNEINILNHYYELYNKAVKFVTTKMRSEKELWNFLEKQETTEEYKTKIISKLTEINLINDERFANAYFQDRLNLSNDGPYKIMHELKTNNISDTVIEDLYSKIDYSLVREKLDRLIQKKIKSNRNKSNFILSQKIIGDMINLGYDKSMITALLETRMKNNDVVVENEYKKIKNKLSKKFSGVDLDRQIKLKMHQKGFSNDEINSIFDN